MKFYQWCLSVVTIIQAVLWTVVLTLLPLWLIKLLVISLL